MSRNPFGKTFTAWAFAAPALMLLLLTLLMPLLAVLFFSFTDWQFGYETIRFVGLDNFVEFFTTPRTRQALINTLVYTAVTVSGTVILGLWLAILIEGLAFGKTFFRTIYFLPVVSTFVAMAAVWEQVLHPTLGLLNTTLAAVGLQGSDWLHDPDLVLWTLCAIGIWENLGFNMVLFLAGLKSISKEYYEAAAIDGIRSAWSRFMVITWPLLGPTTLLVFIISALRSFRVFESVSLLTQGGPGHASEVLLYTIYEEAFSFLRIGYASSVTVVFLLGLLVLTLVQVRVADKRVHYS